MDDVGEWKVRSRTPIFILQSSRSTSPATLYSSGNDATDIGRLIFVQHRSLGFQRQKAVPIPNGNIYCLSWEVFSESSKLESNMCSYLKTAFCFTLVIRTDNEYRLIGERYIIILLIKARTRGHNLLSLTSLTKKELSNKGVTLLFCASYSTSRTGEIHLHWRRGKFMNMKVWRNLEKNIGMHHLKLLKSNQIG